MSHEQQSLDLLLPSDLSVPWAMSQLDDALDRITFATLEDRRNALGLVFCQLLIRDIAKPWPRFLLECDPAPRRGHPYQTVPARDCIEKLESGCETQFDYLTAADDLRHLLWRIMGGRSLHVVVRARPLRTLSRHRIVIRVLEVGREPGLNASLYDWADARGPILNAAAQALVVEWFAGGSDSFNSAWGSGWPPAVISLLHYAGDVMRRHDPGHWLSTMGPMISPMVDQVLPSKPLELDWSDLDHLPT